jgi:hypothetical protein
MLFGDEEPTVVNRTTAPPCLIGLLLLAGCILWPMALFAQGLVPLGEDELPPAGGNARIVTGTVRGPDGPAGGVRVLLDVRNMAFRRPDLSLETRTDPSGRFRFELGEFRAARIGLDLRAHSPRYRYYTKIEEIDEVALPFDFDVLLEPGVLARGRVVDEEGNPLPDVVISHQLMPFHNSLPDGTWEVFGLASPRDRLQFGLDGYVRETLDIESPAPGVYEGFEVVLRSARMLTGQVVNRSDQPLPRPTVRLFNGGRFLNGQTDDEGRFEFRALPAGREDLELLVVAEGYLPARLKVEEQHVNEGIRVVMDPGIHVAGELSLPNGRSAPGTRLVATSGERTLEAFSDRHGRWSVGPFAPRQEIQLFAIPTISERSWAIADLLLKPIAGKQEEYEGDVALWPQGHTSDFRGSWKDGVVKLVREDKGVTGFPTAVHYEAEWDGTSTRLEGTLTVEGMNQRGTFTMSRQTRLGGTMGGVWEIREQVEASSLPAAAVQDVVQLGVLPGRVHLEMQLDEPLRLAGRVLRENGRPFLDGVVALTDWEGTPYLRLEAPIAVDGAFEFPRVPRGTFTLMANDSERETWVGPVILRGGIEDAVLQAGPPSPDPIDD